MNKTFILLGVGTSVGLIQLIAKAYKGLTESSKQAKEFHRQTLDGLIAHRDKLITNGEEVSPKLDEVIKNIRNLTK